MAKSKQEIRVGLWLEFACKALIESSQELLAVAASLEQDFAFAYPEANLVLTAFVHNTAKTEKQALTALPVDKVYAWEKPYLPLALAKGIFTAYPKPDLFLLPMSLVGRELGFLLGKAYAAPYFAGVKSLSLKDQALTIGCLAQDELREQSATLPWQPNNDSTLVLGLSGGGWGVYGLPTSKPEAEVVEANLSGQEVYEYQGEQEELTVEEGTVVVSGGLGIKDAASFAALNSLGVALNSPVGGSRVAEDKGWIDNQAMIGATGKTINAQAYLAFGISGAVQHMVGIEGCQQLIAVNKDPLCAMMKNADLAVVGDCQEVLTNLLELLQGYKVK